MDLSTVIKKTEDLGITILFCNMPKTKGRYDSTLEKPCIYVDKSLSDIEKINIILHEKMHFTKNDQSNCLSYISSYSHHIENQAEKDRILDFMNLINEEYPIDESFNYINYMKNACVPEKYEGYIKNLAKEFYLRNHRKES
ncbi:ImmA/IrrE family metallo-endopeptidase [Streptococcus agalactiae]|uniref:ImmA/IrrE family metallo-endopeptidase n=1 Tax=Streptococcus agalactiae TaxID=1311 RepID=UPI000EB20C28|nr:ImmA/IrrE family metallo-endopeptidase [Streptococcus agalactiae]KAF1107259.1 ImmA/IrrE family metallo-endopeptidase [Streptococcus agalactiae]KAF1140197.1 ImmA/IrrE family metallo-endopeptidase [Streptococcus agalactiae]KAF1145974.1 ImmA/IrrE family metallo-endopeptidase [Streptococcus agalactiae]KAF1147693.1 ImmA/IrrE family metallo-endopeptidase [Streptococcus agalactiae]KAF1167559.1 ImmA/IrrE family metallo-endopeptidase [Streptococcus agalactiae]